MEERISRLESVLANAIALVAVAMVTRGKSKDVAIDKLSDLHTQLVDATAPGQENTSGENTPASSG